MYQELYEYLVLHSQLNLPGIGTLVIERTPAGTDITHRQINAPVYSVALFHNNATPAKKFFYWLADKLNIHYNEAIVRFNGFVFDMRQRIMSGNKITWHQVGILSKGMAGEIRFQPFLKDQAADPPVSAVKIIREKAVHTVRVGEEEKTSEEMAGWLNPEVEKKSYWWLPALIALIILAILIILYFSQQGWKLSSAGNQQKISSEAGAVQYTIIK